MPYGRLDDRFHSHPKRAPSVLSLAADGLLARAISYASGYKTDGFVSEAWVQAQLPGRGGRRVLEEATKRALLDVLPTGSTTTTRHRRGRRTDTFVHGPFEIDGYLIHDYLDDHSSREEIAQQAKDARDRKAKSRQTPDLLAELDRDVTRDGTRDVQRPSRVQAGSMADTNATPRGRIHP